ncbi:Protein phosphatase 2C [Artemisia annua]|uniref:Protein phosphatase 2C n=1 Tax=Artemisia annua TaxID=35608 RepID=A0A2U1PDN1_ARTAN|nr:Protein phosphatase 2C [Artemisia annua]
MDYKHDIRKGHCKKCTSIYASHGVCSKTPTMEDAAASISNVPQFMKIPVRMLAPNRIIKRVNPNLFGSYEAYHKVFIVIRNESTMTTRGVHC